MTLVTEARLKMACKDLDHGDYSRFLKPRITFRKNWFGINRKYIETNFYQDWIEYSHGMADDGMYLFFLNRFFDINGLERPVFSLKNLERAKNCLYRQHELSIGGLGLNTEEHTLPPTNFLVYTALIRGYTEENFISTLGY